LSRETKQEIEAERDRLRDRLEGIRQWNEHTLSRQSAYLGAQLNTLVTGEKTQLGFH
jgi:hypothetical protein